jgi:hypothetical protein
MTKGVVRNLVHDLLHTPALARGPSHLVHTPHPDPGQYHQDQGQGHHHQVQVQKEEDIVVVVHHLLGMSFVGFGKLFLFEGFEITFV